jgi:hypothetical protein
VSIGGLAKKFGPRQVNKFAATTSQSRSFGLAQDGHFVGWSACEGRLRALVGAVSTAAPRLENKLARAAWGGRVLQNALAKCYASRSVRANGFEETAPIWSLLLLTPWWLAIGAEYYQSKSRLIGVFLRSIIRRVMFVFALTVFVFSSVLFYLTATVAVYGHVGIVSILVGCE